MSPHEKTSLISLVLILVMTIIGLGIGYIAGKETATAEIKFELLSCSKA